MQQTRSEKQAENFKGGQYTIHKSVMGDNGKRQWEKVDEEPIKGKKNAVRRADQLQAIARKANRAAERSYKDVTYYWVMNIKTGTIVYQP